VAAREVEVRIQGLNELRRALKQVDSGLPKEMKRGFARIAERIVSKVAPKVPSRSGRARASLTARASGAIAAGGSKAQHYPWLDFGGSVGRHKSIKREFVPQGRYLYPTIGEESGRIKEDVDAVLVRLIEAAGFETRG
jgi:hypothetical protein